jgi:23S rRNA pseudouridine2605 synthase
MERLQKIIARSGYCSRRKAEEYIKDGKVKVNGLVVNELGSKAKYTDLITVEDNVIIVQEYHYLLMNKPRYILSTTKDELDRKTVISILPTAYQKLRLYPVGRLDYDTKGVLLLTNDGNFMNALVGPKSNLEKEYLVRINGIIKKEELRRLEAGVIIDNYKTRRCKTYLKTIDRKNNSSLVGIILKEGKYHQVKKMFASIGYEVKHLTRIRFGHLTTDGLKEGEFRKLTPHEIKILLLNTSES